MGNTIKVNPIIVRIFLHHVGLGEGKLIISILQTAERLRRRMFHLFSARSFHILLSNVINGMRTNERARIYRHRII